MAPPEWYLVTPEQIVDHAGKLGGVADAVREASTAVARVSVPGDGYGESGTQFAAMLDGMAAEGRHTLNAAIDALGRSATRLKNSAADYADTEDAARRRMDNLDTQP